MKLNRIVAAVLAGAIVFSLAACGSQGSSSAAPSGSQVAAVENPITQLSISYGTSYSEPTTFIDVYEENGAVTIMKTEDINQVRGTTDASVFDAFTLAYNEAGLAQFAGKSEYGDGEASGSCFVSFADGTTQSFDFSGDKVPAEFVTGFEAILAVFEDAAKTMEPYKAQVQYMDDVNAAHKDALEALMNGADNLMLENVQGMNVPSDDENYAFNTGVDYNDNITSTTVLMNMMATVPHSIALFELADASQAQAMSDDIMANVNWMKWVCVTPETAMVAVKDNYVVYALTLNDFAAFLETAFTQNGWTLLANETNPSL